MRKVVSGLLLLIVIILVGLFTYKITKSERNNASVPAVTVVIPSASTEKSQSTVENESTGSPIKQDIDEQKIEAIVAKYIINNPEKIIESIELMQKRKMQEIEASVKNYITSAQQEIENVSAFPVLGNSEADVIIVAFYDYACSYCKRGSLALDQILQVDNKVKVILRPLPVLGENSVYAAKVALTVFKIAPDKFRSIHEWLISAKSITEAVVDELITANALDLRLIKAEMNKPEIQELLDKNYAIAENIKIRGVPAYIINSTLVPGLLDLSQFKKTINDARASSSNSNVSKNNTEARQ